MADGTAIATEGFTWNVNAAISLGPIGTVQNNEGDVVSFHVTALDSGTASLTYSQSGLPYNLSINPSTGVISGTIAAGTGNNGGFSPVITVTDGTDVATEGFAWNVNAAISLGPIGTLQNNEGDVVSFHVKALDSNSGATLTFSQSGLPNGLSINPTSGIITGTIAAGAGNTGAFSPVITVNDGTDVAYESFAWNIAAGISLGPIGTLQNNEGDVVSFNVKAMDANSTASLTYSQSGLPYNLSINPTSGLISGTIAAGAGNGGAYSPVITVTDGTDSASESFAWNVASFLSLSPIGTLQNNEGDVVSFHVKALDSGTASLTYSQSGLPYNLSINPSSGLISGTIAAGTGNAGAYSPVITVTDGTAIASEGFAWNVNAAISLGPIGTLQNNEGDVVSFQVKALDSGTASLTYSQSGLPYNLSINPTSGLISGTIAAGAGNGGTYSPVITVTDGTAIASESFAWNVASLLSLSPIGTLQNNEGDVVSFHVKALDSNSGATLTFSQSGLPNGLSINPTSGIIAGTIAAGAGNTGAFSPVITVNDGTDSASESFAWNVASFLSLSPVGTLQNNDGDVVSFHVKALDSNSGATLTFSQSGLPNGLSINPTSGVIAGTIAAGAGNTGAFSPVIMVNDGTDSASESFAWNVASFLSLSPIGTLQNNEGDVVSFHVKALDSNSGATLTFSQSGLPNGLSINPTSGIIAGTIAAGAGNTGAFSPVITVNDGTDSASEGFTWNVASFLSLSPIGTLQNNEGDVVSFDVKALDSNSGATLTFSQSGLPNGLSINPTSGLISGTIAAGAGNTGAFSPVITVNDGTDSASEGFTWNVASFLSLSPIGTLQNNEGDVVSFHVKALDSNSGATLTFSQSGLPNGLSINPTSGIITGRIAAGAGTMGSFTPVITVNDGTDSASEGFAWNVASFLSLSPIGTLQNNEGDVVSFHVKALDSDSGATLTFSQSGLPNGLSINPTSGIITGTIAAGAGNTGAFSPVITVNDGTDSASEGFAWNIAAGISLGPIGTLQNNEGDVVSFRVKALDSNSGATLTFSQSGLPNGLSINPTSGIITGTIAAGAGNTGAFSPVITVNDGTDSASESFTWNVASPLAIALISDRQNTEGNTVSLAVKAIDANSLSLTYTATDLPNGVSINPTSGVIAGTIAAGAGNTGAFTPVITVEDGTAIATASFEWNVASALSITGIASQVNNEGATVSWSAAATDANSLSLTWSAAGLPSGVSINPTSGLISGTVAAGAGNTPTYTPVLTVEDGISMASATFTWTVSSAITIIAIGSKQNSEGNTVSWTVTATDANSLSLTYSANSLPYALNINPTSGLISGTIAAGAGNTGAFTPVITVTDGTDMASTSFTWNIASAISISPIATISSSEGSTVSWTATAIDANSLSLTWSATGLPSNVSINPTSGLVTGTIAAGAANAGPLTPVVTVTDGTDVANMGFTWNVASAIFIASIGTQTNNEGAVISWYVTASDANSLPLYYSASGLPAGLTIYPTSGLISGTIAAGAANSGGTFIPVIMVGDGTSGASESFTWNVGSAITLSSIRNQQSTAGTTVSLQVTATDANSLPLTYGAGGLPLGLSINPSTGLISGTIVAGVANGTSYQPTIGVTDGTSYATESFTWTIGAIVQGETYYDQENTTLTVTAANGVLANDTPPAGRTLTATLLTSPQDGTLSLASTGSFVYTPNSNWFGSDSFTYTASDGNVNSPAVTVVIDTNEVLSQSNNNFVAVATGDFNGDGNQDFVAANESTNAISVFLGNGNGTFQTPSVISVGTAPVALAVGDLGNGGQDIVVANSGDNTVTVLRNYGNGTFYASQVLTVGTDPTALALGDFEGNGLLDLAVVNTGSNTVDVFLNEGNGQFPTTPNSTLSVGTSPSSVVATDLSNDGVDDLVVASAGSNYISVLMNYGNGTFAAAVNYNMGTGSAPSAVVAADFNGDGNMDIAVANSGTNSVSVLMGNGDGTLGTTTSYTTGADPVDLAVGLVDGGGLPDIIVADHGSNTETNLENTGGTFTAMQQPVDWAEHQDYIALADFNNDGVPDQVTDGTLELWLSTKKPWLALQSVSFTDVQNPKLGITPDPTQLVPKPKSFLGNQWFDANGDGKIEPADGDHAQPLVFARNNTIRVKAVFQVDPGVMNLLTTGLSKTKGWTISAGSSMGQTFTPTAYSAYVFNQAKNTLTITATRASSVGDKVQDVYYCLVWYLNIKSEDPTAPLLQIGQSMNPLYVIYKDPTIDYPSIKEYLTLVDLGTKYATGLGPNTTDAARIPGDVFKAFETRKIVRVEDSMPLRYWSNWALAATVNTAEGLLMNGDGNCFAWSNLFLYALADQGVVYPQNSNPKIVVASRYQSLPAAGFGEFLLVKNWYFLNQNQNPPFPVTFTRGTVRYPYSVLVPSLPGRTTVQDLLQSQQTGRCNFTRLPNQQTLAVDGNYVNGNMATPRLGLPGQSSPAPYSLFSNHSMVVIGNVMYDPSYGKEYFGANQGYRLAVYEHDNIAGFAYVPNPQGAIIMYIRETDAPYTDLVVTADAKHPLF